MVFGINLDTGAFTGFLFAILSSLIFWIVLGVVFLFVALGLLIIRKKRKLQFPTYILTDLGGGKMGINSRLKSGWFKHHTALFGLWDYGGEEVLKTKDNRIILDASSEDFQDINGKRGLVVIRSPEDPRILVPVSKMRVSNSHLINEIAPASYREASVSIIKQAEKETSDRMEKIVQYIAIGLIVIFALISIIMIVQMIKNSQAEAKDLVLEAGRITRDNIEQICRSYVSTSTPGASP